MLPLQTKTTCTVSLGCRAWIRCATTGTSTPRRGCSTSRSTSGARPRRGWLRDRLVAALDDLARYPSAAHDAAARDAVAARHGRRPDEVLVLAGSAEGFALLPALRPRLAAVVHPGFTEPEAALRAAGVPVVRVLTDAADGHRLRPDAVPADGGPRRRRQPDQPHRRAAPRRRAPGAARARGGSCSSTRRSRTPCPASPSRWRAEPGLPRVPQPHEDLGARRAAGGLRARRARACWPGSRPRGRRGRCRRSRWRRSSPARRPRPWRRPSGPPATWSGSGPSRRRRSRRCRGSRCCRGARRSCCCGCPTARASGCAPRCGRRASPCGAATRSPASAPTTCGSPSAPPTRSAAARRGARRGAGRGRAGAGVTHGSATRSPRSKPPTRPGSPPTGTRSGWSAATPAEPLDVGARRASIPSRRPSTRRSTAARSCSSPTTRCCCAACTASAPTPRRARSCTASSARARRCSPRTPTPTPPTPASPTRSPPRSGSTSTGPLVAADRRAARQDRHVRADRARPRRRARRARRGGRGQHRRLHALLVRHRGHRPVQAARRGAPDDRRGRAAGAGGRDPAGDGAAPRPAGRGGGGAAGRAPVRGARVRRAGARPDARRRAASAGSARCPRRSRSRPSPRGSRPGCPPRRGACGPRATRTGRSSRVAVCGGAGDSALDAALAAGVDAYVTADLRHHPASEHLLRPGGARAGRRRALGVGVAVVRAGGGASCAPRWAVASRSASPRGAPTPGRIGSIT